MYDFVELTVVECGVDIHLVAAGVFATSEECEQSANRCVFGDGSESFIIILPPLLGETFGAKASLVKVVDVLDMENPARFDDFASLGQGTRVQVSFFMIESYSFCMAISHCFASAASMAS